MMAGLWALTWSMHKAGRDGNSGFFEIDIPVWIRSNDREPNIEEAPVAKNQGNLMNIVAWGVAGAMALAAIGAGLWGAGQSGQAAKLREVVVELAAVAGVQSVATAPAEAAAEGEEAAAEPQELTMDLLKNESVLSAVLEKAAGAIQANQRDLETARGDLDSAQGQLMSAQGETAALNQKLGEQAAQVETLTAEAAAAGEAASAAQAELTAATEAASAAAEAAAKEKKRLQAAVEKAKNQQAKEVARLATELALLKGEIEPVEAAEDEEYYDAAQAEAAPAEAAAAEEAFELPVGQGRVIGTSEMFTTIQRGEDESLSLRFLDGQTVTYESVPDRVVDQLAMADKKLDKVYLFHVQGQFKSVPPDSIVVRKFWKWQRRHKARGDVYLIEPEKPAESAAEPEETGETAADE